MTLVLLSFFTGTTMGFIFSLIKLPIPAPLSLAGVMGVVGVYAGYKLYQVISPFF